MNFLLTAVEFLTRLSIRRAPPADLEQAARSQPWFPAVGLLIGAILVGTDRLAGKALPATSVDVLLVVALALLTGGLHLDGLADSADAIGGGEGPEQRLEIMHDTHSGSFAVVAIVSVLALKWAGLNALPPAVRIQTLLITPCLARLAILVLTAAVPPARTGGLYATFHARAGVGALLCGVLTALAAPLLLFGAGGLFPLLFVVACAAVAGGLAVRLVGGMTGDLCGATVEATEALLFLFIPALAARGWISPLAFG